MTSLPRLLVAAAAASLVLGLAACNEGSNGSAGGSGAAPAGQAAGGAAAGGAAGGGQQPPPQVGVVTLKRTSIPITATVPGRTVASAVAEIRPQVNGIVRSRVFREGSEVKAGDLLYEIDPVTYEASVAAAEATLARARAAVPTAQAKLDRINQLSSISVSQQDRDDAQAALKQAQADVASAEAQLKTAQINLGYTKVTAPIDGLIGTSSVTQGALVTANQTTALATIREMDPMYVDLTESSSNLLRVRRLLSEQPQNGAPPAPPTVRLTLEDGTAYEPTGIIRSLETNVSPTTGTITVRAEVPNPKRLLLPGMYVRATVEIGAEQQVYLVPQRAVSRNPKGEATATFVTADGKAESRTLTATDTHGSDWVVTEGVKDGDRIVVEGAQSVRPGQPVTAVAVTIDEEGLVRSADAGAAAGGAEPAGSSPSPAPSPAPAE